MSTRYQGPKPGSEAQQLALLVRSRREMLLRLHAHRLAREDLEDCWGQAVLELLARIRAGGRFAGAPHMERVLEQRFRSRVQDRQRALAGRSPLQAALFGARRLASEGDASGMDLSDPKLEPAEMAVVRDELRRVLSASSGLKRDQRLAIGAHLAEPDEQARLRRALGWSPEKHRKVSQRARARLRRLMEEEEEAGLDVEAGLEEEADFGAGFEAGFVPAGGGSSEEIPEADL